MPGIFFIPVAIVYLVVVSLLFVYGLNFFYLSWLTWRSRGQPQATPQLTEWPRVTVQLPIFNELYVAERVIRAAARLDYPSHLLEIQVLDDSTDETRTHAAEIVSQLRDAGVNITHLHREQRTGYKAGALAYGMERAAGEFIAIFDADFVPPPDFLRRTLPHLQDEKVAFVQARWGHLNRRYSLLTFLQSLAIDAHFVVEQFGRSRSGYWFNFNGTAGVWRRSAIVDAGGWRADTLTEDLDLSYRAFLKGWRAVYVRDVEAPAELPANFNAYRRQQHRWAHGSLECAARLLPRVWAAPAPLARKLEATLHLTGYGVHILLFVLALLYPLVLMFSLQFPGLISLFGIAVAFNATAFAPTLYFVLAQQQLQRDWRRMLPVILFITVLGTGMMLNTTRAAFQAARGRSSSFQRTPKFGVIKRGQFWFGSRYRLKLDPIVFAELLFAGFNFGTVLFAVQLGNWLIAIYAALFCAGLVFTAATTAAHTVADHWQFARQRAPGARVG